MTEPIRRWRHGFLFASGQAIRKSVDQPGVLRRLIGRQRYKGALLGWLGLGLASTRSRRLLVGWLVASLLGFGTIARRLGVQGAAQFTLSKLLGLLGLLYGLRLSTRSPYEYPLQRVEVIQGGELLGGKPSMDANEEDINEVGTEDTGTDEAGTSEVV